MPRWCMHDNMRSIYHIDIICMRSRQIICVSYIWIDIDEWHDGFVIVDLHPIMSMTREDWFPSWVTKMCLHTFRSMHEHESPSQRMTSEPRLGLPAQFELDRSGAQSEVLGKTSVSDFLNRMIRFWQSWHSPAARIGDEDRANLHPSGV
jgi:hypothetical protein